MKAWLESRTGIPRALGEFFGHSIPSSTGWRNTSGSVVGALFLGQIISGVLLMLFYVPHPESAFASVTYIASSLRAGAFVRALHYWGASFMIIGLFFHMMRVFFSGAYKKPREVTWIVGLCLFGLVLFISLTGQLLPWNQAGYWAAKVAVEIGSSVPLLGPVIRNLAIGGESIGALTLTRFYALHVVVLPGIIGVLIVLHIYLVRKHGPNRPAGDKGTSTIAFFPDQVARDMVAVSISLAALAVVARIVGSPAEMPADPSDTSNIPRPEWYFLSHFELLRFTPGSLKVAGTFFIPSALCLLLAALPWIDRVPDSTWRQRKLVLGGGVFLFLSVAGLTALGLTARDDRATAIAAVEQREGYDKVAAGRRLFRQGECIECHKVRGRGGTTGPDLTYVGTRLREEFIRDWLADPQGFSVASEMPPFVAESGEMDEIVAYLKSLVKEPAR